MVELADGVRALGLAEQGVVGSQAGVVGFVVEGRIVARDDAGRVEGVDVAGAAGPGHLKAADGDEAAGILGVELADGALVGAPAVRGVGILDKRGVIQRRFGVGAALAVEIVGVVGKGHELHVGAGRQVPDIG